MKYFSLVPAYGRDYKKPADIRAAFNEGKDFEGDFALNFQLVNKQDLEGHRPYTANLRYNQRRSIAQVIVK